MTTTTAPPTTTGRRAGLGAVGGTLWLLMPAAFAAAELDAQPRGSLSFFAVAASYWLCLVLAPALVAVGYTALRTALGSDAGRVARTGVVLAPVGLGAMALGNGIEVGSMSLGGGEVALGHAMFLIGFLVSTVGGVLAGIAVVRRLRDTAARAAGWLLVLALPLGIGIGALASAVAPGNDAGFFAAIAVPTGLAWLLLGRSLATSAAPAAAPR